MEEVWSESAVELVEANSLATSSANGASLYHLVVEPENWNATMLSIREIFEAEILISGDGVWVAFRILQAFGVNQGKLAYQFTPTFTETLST